MLILFLVKLLESVVFMDIGDTVRRHVIASDHDHIREAVEEPETGLLHCKPPDQAGRVLSPEESTR